MNAEIFADEIGLPPVNSSHLNNLVCNNVERQDAVESADYGLPTVIEAASKIMELSSTCSSDNSPRSLLGSTFEMDVQLGDHKSQFGAANKSIAVPPTLNRTLGNKAEKRKNECQDKYGRLPEMTYADSMTLSDDNTREGTYVHKDKSDNSMPEIMEIEDDDSFQG